MLTTLDSTLFDSIAGLPLHPLVVHFAVVLLPLAALGIVLLVAVPTWADRFGWLTLGVLFVGTGAAFVAKESGEALATKVGAPAAHTSWGDQLPWLAVGLLILAGAWWALHRTARKGGLARSAASTVVGLLAAVMAVIVTAVTVIVGHTGAQAAWGGVTAAPPAASASVSPASPKAKASKSPSPTSDGTTTGAYPLSAVAQHASATSCWTAIDGQVYDLTDWVSQHPGGRQAILGICGKDGTAAFNAQHGGQGRAAAELRQFRIGTLG